MTAACLALMLLAASPKGATYPPSQVGTDKRFGAGLTFGEPSGITGKVWFTDEVAMSFMFGSLISKPGPVFGLDFAYHLRNLAPRARPIEVGVHFDVGAAFGFWSRHGVHQHRDPWLHEHRHDFYDPMFFVRTMAGGSIWLRKIPLEMFFELGPALLLVPRVELFPSGALGIRYYF